MSLAAHESACQLDVQRNQSVSLNFVTRYCLDHTHLGLRRRPRFLYALIALDANFKLKNKLSTSWTPGLGTGWAYFVEEKHYRNHLAQYGTQKEVSVLLSPPDTY